MKKYFKYIFCAGLGLMLFTTSCRKSYLTPIPQTSITDATAFDTPARVLNQVTSLYGALKSGSFFGGRAQVAGDIRGEDFINETTNGVTGYDVWYLNATGTSQNFIKNCWSQAYYVINLCNLFIDGMAAKGSSVVGSALSGNYLGEAKFIRALTYYWLLQFYARPYADGNGTKPGLPLRLTGIKGSGSSDLARSSVADVYTQIIADLNFAEQNLPADYSGSSQATLRTTRAHKNTAIALKTRVYLAMQQYANVITEANKIVSTSAPFSATTGVPNTMQPDISVIFRTNFISTESMLSMPMTTTSGDNPGTQNQLGYYFVQNGSSLGSAEFSLNAVNGILADPGWTATDKRKTALVYTNTTSGKKYLSKYILPSPYTDWAPVIRYSEVLLNLAEALARTNSATADPRGLALVNAVRQRSDPTTTLVATTQAQLIALVMTERRIELLGEGFRNYDLMRLLQTIPTKGSVAAKASSESGYIWPISSDEMSLNHLMTDNP